MDWKAISARLKWFQIHPKAFLKCLELLKKITNMKFLVCQNKKMVQYTVFMWIKWFTVCYTRYISLVWWYHWRWLEMADASMQHDNARTVGSLSWACISFACNLWDLNAYSGFVRILGPLVIDDMSWNWPEGRESLSLCRRPTRRLPISVYRGVQT